MCKDEPFSSLRWNHASFPRSFPLWCEERLRERVISLRIIIIVVIKKTNHVLVESGGDVVGGGDQKNSCAFLRAVLHCHVKRGAAAACGGGLVSPRQPHLTACAAVMQLCYA